MRSFAPLVLALLSLARIPVRSAQLASDLEVFRKSHPDIDPNTPVYWDVAADPRTSRLRNEPSGDALDCVVVLYYHAITERAKDAIAMGWSTGFSKEWWRPDIITPWCPDGAPASAKNGSAAYPDDSIVFTATRGGKKDDGAVVILGGSSNVDGESETTQLPMMKFHYRNKWTAWNLEKHAIWRKIECPEDPHCDIAHNAQYSHTETEIIAEFKKAIATQAVYSEAVPNPYFYAMGKRYSMFC